jgi:excinuclease UvrABC nuclease subunit
MTFWGDLDAATRHAPATLSRDVVPDAPGVYAWYRDGQRVYVGKADSLRDRVWGNHLGQSRAPMGSAFRRNVAEHLGFGSAANMKSRTVTLSDEQLAAIRGWIMSCEVAWLVCDSRLAALELETKLKSEFRPPLTKI